MIAASDLITAARSFIGVPFAVNGRTRAGMDCAGLVLAVAEAVGLDRPAILHAAPLPDLRLFDVLDQYAMQTSDFQPGLLLRLSIFGRPQHLAFVGDLAGRPSLIHSYQTAGKVTEHAIDAKWRRRIVSAWRINGVLSWPY